MEKVKLTMIKKIATLVTTLFSVIFLNTISFAADATVEMGMIGFIIVGDDKSNLDAIKAIRYSGKSKKIAPDLINSL